MRILEVDSTQKDNTRHEDSYGDILQVAPYAGSSFSKVGSNAYSYLFSLDDLSAAVAGNADGVAIWVSGSRFDGNSFTAVSGTYEEVLDVGYNRFTVPLYGGFNGLDIRDKEPFNNTDLSDGTDASNYAYYTIRRAVDTVADPEVAEYNLMTIPGVWHEPLTEHVINVCEGRGDALALIDLKTGYYADTENTESV